MTSKEILAYFDATEGRDTRADLKLGVGLVEAPGVAVDCGCGAGSDIAFLRAHGFRVYAFDIEEDAIARCQRRFRDDTEVIVSRDSFSTFDFPRASLIVADASLFFCPENEFAGVWANIKQSLSPKGVFVGSFLGPEDTMAGPDFDKTAFWPNVLVASEEQVRAWCSEFEVVSFTEHKVSGKTVNGAPHNWHIFAVVAQKSA